MKYSPVILTLCCGALVGVALAGQPVARSLQVALAPAGTATASGARPAPAVEAQWQAAVRQRAQARRRQLRQLRRERQKMRRQLQRARRRLELAAQQVAELSARLIAPVFERWPFLASPDQGVIGVQLDSSGGAAGARVRAVSPGGAAARAGVRAGDLIVALDGTNVRGRDPARRVVQLMRHVKPGDRVRLRVLRNGKPRELTLIAQSGMAGVFRVRPPTPAFPGAPPPPPSIRVRIRGMGAPALSGWGGPVILRGPLADMKLTRLSPQLGRYFGTDSGVLVVRAPPKGALGLRDGDVILAIGGRRPADSSQAIRIFASYDSGEKITMQVLRMHHKITVTTVMPPAEPVARVKAISSGRV